MMLFGQLSNCDSMRDLCILIDAHLQKPYSLDFGKSVVLSTLYRANASRDYRIYEEFASLMIAKAQKYRAGIDFDIQVDGKVCAFDLSTVSLCLNVFWRATCKRQKGAIKLHTLYDVRTQIPDFIVVTPASVNTNDFISDAKTITEPYRKRWSVELFFKWIKQHLKIKQLWGTTENAVKIQVNCAVIAYSLVSIVAKTLKTERTIYELLQIFGKSLLDKTPVIIKLITKMSKN